ncbi:hypothetical protein BU23DRAFT_570259 [Bimuria novae-zelandiae CBS 107.79]|uniref:Uncharacterized protein n=1 Tax=Bimuria novae-zelandiae CBS 107.79 TaxID=1447943 RepID=A0A6A5V404_9PLEO|nr:hypothetical protein BU23DRAFT_570259 [Bimuria novae-zelandiae CBS 107.79]
MIRTCGSLGEVKATAWTLSGLAGFQNINFFGAVVSRVWCNFQRLTPRRGDSLRHRRLETFGALHIHRPTNLLGYYSCLLTKIRDAIRRQAHRVASTPGPGSAYNPFSRVRTRDHATVVQVDSDADRPTELPTLEQRFSDRCDRTTFSLRSARGFERHLGAHRLRISLAHALSYNEYPNDLSAEPYLNYIANRHVGRGMLDNYLALFMRVVQHFSNAQKQPVRITPSAPSIRSLLATLSSSDSEAMFANTETGSKARKEDVEDTVMYIMGTWTMLQSSFVQLLSGFRKIMTAYEMQTELDGTSKESFDQSLAGWIQGSRMLPGPHKETRSSIIGFEDDVVRTAMKRIALLGQATSMHPRTFINKPSTSSLLTQFDLGLSNSRILHHSLDAMDSLESLSVKATRLNAFTLNVLGAVQISWTHNISCHMLLSRHGGRHVLEIFALPHDSHIEYDPLLVKLMNGTEASDWTQDLFPCLWSRMVRLEDHLQEAKPWSIWILFRDRRDTLQFWTFCFATIVVLLTFLQVALGVVQVVGSFK